VVNCAIAAAIYRKFPELPEGDLSRLRASLVSDPSLAALAAVRGFAEVLRIGAGERKAGARGRPSALAAALEAVVGAAFLDGGFEAADRVVQTLFGAALERLDPISTTKDPKTLLQELLHSRRLSLPRYSVIETRGRAHELLFHVACEIPELGIRCEGEGSSRRSAEQQAARAAYALASQA
jgi:ribonuclease-3